METEQKLFELHKKLKLDFGSFMGELPEQLLSMKYIKPESKVLEIGGNIGRNSLIISSLLNNSENLVTVECCKEIAQQLKHNRDQNNFKFHVVEAAISTVELIQKGWNTKLLLDDEVPEGWTLVDLITHREIRNKYGINFDTLVVDCEGALYYILLQEPEILDGINLIIIENDFMNVKHKEAVDRFFYERGFKCVDTVKGGQVASWSPCCDYFYQVFSK